MNIDPAFVFREAEAFKYSLAKILQCISVVLLFKLKKKKKLSTFLYSKVI